MRSLRASLATLTCFGLALSPVWAAPKTTTSLGTIVTAEKARVGDSFAEVGTTIFNGDRLATDADGSVQVRAGAARLLLQSSSIATVNDAEGAPSAKLSRGTATFSTGNARAFTLYVSRAAIRAQSDDPTIGQATYLSEKDLLVVSKRGALLITVDGETQLIPDGTAYHVLLDPTPAQGPEGAGAHKDTDKGKNKGMNGPPLRAGRNYFTITAVGITAIVTGFAISEAFESPNRP
jgi:hypothetical protein